MAQDTSLQLPATPAFPVVAVRPLAWPLIVAAAVVGLLVWTAVRATYKFQRERESARIEALSELRATQAGDWLAEKMGQVRFAGNSPLGEQYLRWRDDGDLASRDKLLGRLSSFRKASGGSGVLVVDAKGVVLAADPPQLLEATAPLKAAVKRPSAPPSRHSISAASRCSAWCGRCVGPTGSWWPRSTAAKSMPMRVATPPGSRQRACSPGSLSAPSCIGGASARRCSCRGRPGRGTKPIGA